MDGYDVHFGRCDYSVSKSSKLCFLKNDRNYKWASNNSAHMKTEHSIGTVHCKQENISRPFQKQAKAIPTKKSTLNGLLLT